VDSGTPFTEVDAAWDDDRRNGAARPDEPAAAQPAEHQAERPADRAKLAFASFLMLFVELALIRWITSNNVYVTKATNFVLLASFLGIGIGFLNARARRDYLRWTPVTLLLLVGFVLLFPVILSSLSGAHPYRGLHNMLALPQPVSLGVIFVLTTVVMAGLGQAMARTFVGFRALNAYRLDIAGSIAGIAAFSGLSFLNQPPATWGIITCIGLLVLLAPKIRWWQVTAVSMVVAALCVESFVPHQTWSPYNKLSVAQTGGKNPALNVSANNIPYQAARSLAVLARQKPFYWYPYRHVDPASLDNVLIIGAGTGNDTAVALASGAKHVDAVEIDPDLLHLGEQRAPSKPYSSPRVTLHVADGREYLQDTNKKYNLILFALPDSLAAVAGQSAVRLESFLLTKESIAAVKAHLAPGGTFAMYNYYAPFLLNRYATSIDQVFGRVPCQDVGPPLGGRQLAVLTVYSRGAVPNCTSYWHGTRVAPATDDYPFPYLPSPGLPSSYLWLLIPILLGSVLLIRIGGGSGPLRRMHRYTDLAFMGAAFMLLETKNIVQFALLFGATWFVNSLVSAGVLVAVYLAVETARHVRLPRPMLLYAALVVSLAVTWLVPPDAPLGLPLIPRFLAASALAFAPIYIANLIFAQRFSGVEMTGTAFAANLLGAIVGGVIEYTALITGYRFLLIAAGALYALAFVSSRFLRRAGSVPSASLAGPQPVATKIGLSNRWVSTSMPKPAAEGARPRPLFERGSCPATWPSVQSLKNDTFMRCSGLVLAARWLTAAVMTSPPHMSSTDTHRPSSWARSRICTVRARPPTRLTFRLTARAPASLAANRSATVTTLSSSTIGKVDPRCARAHSGVSRHGCSTRTSRPSMPRMARRACRSCQPPLESATMMALAGAAALAATTRAISSVGSPPTFSWNRVMPASPRA
jgi:protein-L-isoaspartate O-methyltransferase